MANHSLPIPAGSIRRRLSRASIAVSTLLWFAASFGAETPSSLEDRVRSAALATYFHGMTEEIAMSEVGVEGLPVLRRLLADREFPRRDNVVAFLAFLGTTEDSHALLALLDAPPASLASPDEARALLLAPQALGQIASRGEPVALQALLEMTADNSRGGVLERTASHATSPDSFRSNLLHMSLRGLAYAGGPAARSRLIKIARGRVEPTRGGPPLNSAAWSALDLRRELQEPRTPSSEAEATDGNEDPPVEAGTGSGVLDSQTRVHDSSLTYANHVDLADPMTDERLDDVLAEASLRAGRGDDPTDVACCVTVSRSGTALQFGSTGDGRDIVDDDPEMRDVLWESTARAKVVTAINYCGGPGTNIIGCAWAPGNGMIVVRMSNLGFEAVLWLHEYGHNTGLSHNPQGIAYVMYAADNGNNSLLTQAECDTFHSPSGATGLTPGDTGACTDVDADLVQDGFDNCPGVANYDQIDSDGDGVGDVCAGPGCGNGVREGTEDCDGSDLGTETCVSLGFAGGDLSCALDCTYDTSTCACTDGDGDGVSECDGDCDDADPTSYPGATEICDGADNDCDGTVDSGIDGDGDTVDDLCDNCPATANGGQEDNDGDGQGDACDSCPADPDNDLDADGLCGDVDNCPGVANANQADADGDGTGDACDSCPADPGNDADGDGVCGDVDNCPATANPTQGDADGDGAGDPCDPCPADPVNDLDGDGACGDVDNCPATANPTQDDTDSDGAGDLCDPCPADPDDDLDGDGVCGDLDGHPDDPDRTGPFHVGVADSLNHNWTTVTLPFTYQDPVVIAGPPSYNGRDPGVVQIRSVSPTSFEIRFEEWAYLDGSHWKAESVPYIVMEKGRYTLDDGSVWETGTFNLAGTQSFIFRQFSSVFDGPPHLLLSAQTVNDAEPVTIRARNVKANGFGVSLFEEEALMDGHPTELVGYLAVYSSLGSGRVTTDWNLTPYLLQSVPVDRRMAPILGWNMKLDEDRSFDPENWHKDETVAALVLGDRLFAQAVSWEGVESFSLRRIDPDASAAVAWGAVDGVDDGWTLVPLPRAFGNPVAIVKVASHRDPGSGAIRLRNVGSDSFEVRFEEWSYLDGVHPGERIFFVVAETGQHDLGGLTVEAGTLDTNKTLGPGGWKQVGLSATFSTAPAVFASIQTVNDTDPVVTRVKQRSSSGFKLTMQEEEADGAGHATETVGWIAVEPGTGTTAAGRNLEVVEASGTHVPGAVVFTQGFDRRFPTMLADVVSANEDDTCGLRHVDIDHRDATLVVEEEQSLDAETDHASEEICLFLAE